ncbi:unnamed protein product [Colias eurytheme]|nr:unnamed protein product [Colias eurytheme]
MYDPLRGTHPNYSLRRLVLWKLVIGYPELLNKGRRVEITERIDTVKRLRMLAVNVCRLTVWANIGNDRRIKDAVSSFFFICDQCTADPRKKCTKRKHVALSSRNPYKKRHGSDSKTVQLDGLRFVSYIMAVTSPMPRNDQSDPQSLSSDPLFINNTSAPLAEKVFDMKATFDFEQAARYVWSP